MHGMLGNVVFGGDMEWGWGGGGATDSVSVDIHSCLHACHTCRMVRIAREFSAQRKVIFYDPRTVLGLQLAYECSCVSLEQLHSKWRDVLTVGRESEDSVAVKHLESAVGLYLKRVCCNHDTTDIVEVTW